MNLQVARGVVRKAVDPKTNGQGRPAIRAAENQGMVDIGARLEGLCRALAAASPYTDRTALYFETTGDCLVPPKSVAPLALIVGEAVTNAIKHSHPTGVRGRIDVRCRRATDDGVLIEVVDDGVGLPEGFDASADGGHGLKTARGLADGIGAKLSFASTSLGLRVRLRVPDRPAGRPNGAGNPGDGLRYRDLLDALPTAVYTTDALGRITFYNEAAAALWGRRPRLGDAWCGSLRLYWPGGEPMAHGDCPMAVAIQENRSICGGEAVVERPDGVRIPFLAYPTPLRDASGALVGAVNTLVDISERRRSEHRQAFLAREMHHRTKNLLTVVCSIVSRGMDGARSMKDTREIVLGRLGALAATYDNLIATSWTGVELDDIIRTELAPYPGQWAIEGPALALSPSAAETLTLAAHELATNAAKYGALSAPSGMVTVGWSVDEVDGTSRFRFAWRERGGPAVEPPARQGFGSLVLERVITQEFGAPPCMDFDPGGLGYALDLPLDAVAPAESAS